LLHTRNASRSEVRPMKLVVLLGLGAIGWFAPTLADAQDIVRPYGYPPGTAVLVPGPFRPAIRIFPQPLVADAFEANPLDDGYDPPFGYGEYAIYGRWAYARTGGANCYVLRRSVRTGHGYRWRAIWRCD